MDEKSVRESITQFKYQTIVENVRSNTERKIERQYGPKSITLIVFPPHIGQIHQRKLFRVAQKNITENITLAVSFVVNASLRVATLKASFQVFFRITILSSPSLTGLWISGIDVGSISVRKAASVYNR